MALLINKALHIRYEVSGAAVVGRSAEAQLQLNFPTVSKQHARIFEQDGRWYVEDLGSANFTYVNGEKIARTELQSGDYIRLDFYTLVFFREEPPQLPELSVLDPTSVIRQRVPVTKPVLRIGRRLLHNHIAIDDVRVSGYHIHLTRQDRRWIVSFARPGVKVLINQHPMEQPTAINPGDKIQIGSTILEISTSTVKEWFAVSQVQTRLGDLYRKLRMQSRTLEEAIHENFPSVRGNTQDWNKMFLDVFLMIDRSLEELTQVADTIHKMIPSMETIESDRVILNQATRTARRCNNLANYLDLLLRNDQLLRIQNADFTDQKELIAKLHSDVQNCLQFDNPTQRL